MKPIDLPEAEALRLAISKAMFAYRDFLADHGLIWKDLDGADDNNPCKVKKLIAEISYEGSEYGEYCEIDLIEDGPNGPIYFDTPTGRPEESEEERVAVIAEYKRVI
jgi:hypothetical protein